MVDAGTEDEDREETWELLATRYLASLTILFLNKAGFIGMKSLRLIFITITATAMSACAEVSRNDLIVNVVSIPFGNLAIQFNDLQGFTEAKGDLASYGIMFRIDDVPKDVELGSLYVKAIIFRDSSKMEEVFAGDWIGGAFNPREKYRDWLVGRYTDVALSFRDYYMCVYLSERRLDDVSDAFMSMELEVKSSRTTKNPFLDAF